jgi:hypothetical protein
VYKVFHTKYCSIISLKFILNQVEGGRQERSLTLLCFLFFSYIISKAQIANYVNNGSFEDCLNCNQSFAPLIAKYWSSLDTNKFFGAILTSLPPTGQVPNSSYTYQWPRTGNNYFISTLFFKPNTLHSKTTAKSM